VDINAVTSQIKEFEKDKLYAENFAELGTTTYLRFGSGLEGFIIKTIKEQLNVPIEISVSPHSVSFVLTLSKKPRK
jgi:hypothetical protein